MSVNGQGPEQPPQPTMLQDATEQSTHRISNEKLTEVEPLREESAVASQPITPHMAPMQTGLGQ